MTSFEIEKRIEGKRVQLQALLDELQTEIQRVRSEIALLNEIYPATNSRSPKVDAGVSRTRQKLSLLEIAKQILTSSREELPSSKIADRAVDQGLWVNRPKSYRASMSGTLGRAINSLECDWLVMRKENRTGYYSIKKNKRANEG